VFNNFSNSSLLILFLVIFSFGFQQDLFAAETDMMIPLNGMQWTALAYNKIAPNDVSFSDSALKVKVRNSAGPLVHKLKQATKVLAFSISGKVNGSKIKESGPFDEDSTLRFGLVGVGKQTLSGPKKWLAADWVKKLYSMAPEGTGIDKIYFFNLTDRDSLLGQVRVHPKSELILENYFAKITSDGSFDLRGKLDVPIETSAIWISIDGDDTKSEFETIISEIKITVMK
jgi:hypothetical protein